MTPFYNVLDPFAGVPGDSMESVLSLQSFAEADQVAAIDYNYNSSGCKNVGDTASCSTNTCDTVGSTSSCNTISCTHA